MTTVLPIRKIYVTSENTSITSDFVAVEEPLHITVYSSHPSSQKPALDLGITLRTPGDDASLCIGYLYYLQIINSVEDIERIEEKERNVIEIHVKSPITDNRSSYILYRSTACGFCGSDLITAITRRISIDKKQKIPKFSREQICKIYEAAASYQEVFHKTGGTHSATLFTPNIEHIQTCEDIGRHNAVDKLIGKCLQEGIIPPDEPLILFLSGRAGFELLHKAAIAGISAVCAVGAPTSLAVQFAREMQILLIGFYRSNSFNIYSENRSFIF